jgi:drug/metabolite transporter (DMT)-like permease
MSHGQANKLLLIAAFLWGAGNVAQQTILENIGPFFAVGLRCIIGGLVILPFTLGRKFNPRCFGVVANRSGLSAILSFGAAVVCQQIGFGYTTVTNAGFIINTTAVITPLIAWMLSLHRPEAKIWPAAALTLLGAAFMTNGSIGGFNIGDLYCLASAVFFSLWMIYLGEFVKRYGNAAQLTLAQFFLSGTICLVIGTAFEAITLNSLRNALPELMLLGTLSTGAAYLLQSIAQKNTSAGEAAVITSGEAVFGAIGAFLLIGERLTLSGGTGAALVLCGILILQLPPRAMVDRWEKYIIRRRTQNSKDHEFRIHFTERASPTPAEQLAVVSINLRKREGETE